MSSNSHKKPRFLYSKETLKEALAAIRNGMPINTASNKYHVPRSTLHSKVNQKYADKRPGPDTVMTTNEENLLVQWIHDCNKKGMPVGKQHLLNSVALVVKTLNRENPFANGRPGRHWYQSFLKRHENIVDKINENTVMGKASLGESGVRKWFANLKMVLNKKDLSDIHPSRIFTTETLMLESPEVNEDKESLYVQMTSNAAGELLPSMIVYAYQKIPSKIYQELPPGWVCGKSENGFMTAENFYDYITKSFYPWLIENNIETPVVLYMDGKIPYLTLSLSDFCARNNIEIITLHPNSTELLHPLNVRLLPMLKQAWSQELIKYRQQSKAVNFPNENIATLLSSMFCKLDTVDIIRNGFKMCGICPLSENAVNYQTIPEKVVEKVQKEKIEFSPFIPENNARKVVKKSQITPKFLEILEEYISPDTLQVFKSADINADWTGRIEDKSLFHLWRNIVNQGMNDENNTNSQEVYISSFEQNLDSFNTAAIEAHFIETDIDSSRTRTDNVDIMVDPLKLCITKMEET